MKRPFFVFAIFLAVLTLTFRFFVKENVFPAGHISHFISKKPRHLAIKGIVINDPLYTYLYFRKAETFVVRPILIKVRGAWFPAYGNMRVTSYADKEAKYGDEILFEATLKSPSRGEDSLFDYKRYLEVLDIHAIATISDKDPLIITGRGKGSLIKAFAYNVKALLRRNMEYLFKPPERYFLLAVLLGERQHIPEEWKDIFIKTQTMHLLAISGLHVGIVTFIIFLFAGLLGLPRNFRYGATIVLIILYAIMVGGRPSVARATIMAVVLLGSYLLKKDADIYNSLGLAAAVIILYNPDQLFDYGFILSFASVLSIVYMTPCINNILRINKLERKKWWGGAVYYLSALCSASLAVCLGLLPLTVNFFNIVSLISVIANIFAIPALFVIIALAIFSLVIQPISSFLGSLFAESTEFFIAALVSCLNLSSKLPFSYFKVNSQNITVIILYYAALVGIIEYTKRRMKRL